MASLFLVSAAFTVLVLLAAFFASWPLVRAQGLGRAFRAALLFGVVLAIAVVGGGLYVVSGTPSLALRDLRTPSDVPSLIAALAYKAREGRFDATGWSLLGRGYLSLGDANDAAVAFRRAADVAPAKAQPALLSAYGEALTVAASGSVTPDAEQAFRSALAGNPKDTAARYYLGLALAERGRNSDAARIWKGLLADTPPNAPWRAQVVDRLAALEGSAGVRPDIASMITSLSDRLKTQPNDPDGWQRLIRAYAVMGDSAAARTAMVRARKALSGNPVALASIESEAKSLKLQ